MTHSIRLPLILVPLAPGLALDAQDRDLETAVVHEPPAPDGSGEEE